MRVPSFLLAVLVGWTNAQYSWDDEKNEWYSWDDGCCYKKTLECMQCRYPKRTWPLDFCLLEPEALKDDPWCNANVNKARFPTWPNTKPMNMGWYKRPFCCQELSLPCIMCNYPQATKEEACMLHPRELGYADEPTCFHDMYFSDWPDWPFLAPIRPEWYKGGPWDKEVRNPLRAQISSDVEAYGTEGYWTAGVAGAVGIFLVVAVAAFVVYRFRTKTNGEESASEFRPISA